MNQTRILRLYRWMEIQKHRHAVLGKFISKALSWHLDGHLQISALLGLCLVCCFLRNTALTHDILSLSEFPISSFRRCCFSSWFFFFNPAFHNNSCIQVSLLESCKYLLQCRAGDPLSVSLPLERFTAWTNFSVTGCSHCLNYY